MTQTQIQTQIPQTQTQIVDFLNKICEEYRQLGGKVVDEDFIIDFIFSKLDEVERELRQVKIIFKIIYDTNPGYWIMERKTIYSEDDVEIEREIGVVTRAEWIKHGSDWYYLRYRYLIVKNRINDEIDMVAIPLSCESIESMKGRP